MKGERRPRHIEALDPGRPVRDCVDNALRRVRGFEAMEEVAHVGRTFADDGAGASM